MIKKVLKSLVSSFEALFFTGWRDWKESARVPGLRDVEIQIFFYYVVKLSPIYIFLDRRQFNYPVDNFIYGEIPYQICREFVEIADITEKDVVYDLGCGRGKFLFFVRLFTNARCIGVDLLPTYIKCASRIIEKLKIKRIHFFCEDMLNVDLLTASVILIHGTTFTKELREELLKKFERLRPGARLISITKPFKHPRLKLFYKGDFLLSWGISTVYFYRLEEK